MENISIGKRVKELRQELDLTQSNFADMIGISKAMVSIIEIDKSIPTFDTIRKICTVFDISADYFFDEGDISPKNYLSNSNTTPGQMAAKPIDLWREAISLNKRFEYDLEKKDKNLFEIYGALSVIDYLSVSLNNFLPTIYVSGVGRLSDYQNELPANHPLKLDYKIYYANRIDELKDLVKCKDVIIKFCDQLTYFLANMKSVDKKNELPNFNPKYTTK